MRNKRNIPKNPTELIDDELLTIMNRIFMEGGAAYREPGIFWKWRGHTLPGHWEQSMYFGSEDLKEYFKKKGL